jgi:hypothetical protein|tara:strand:- start:1402 stop:2055 length:654 start_codon:yes stop_codon:yes gene_type:complete
MAITHANFLTQVRNYTEVSSSVLSDSLLDQFIKNTELDIASKVDYDDLRKFSNSTFTASNRAVSLPGDLKYLRAVKFTNGSNQEIFLEKRDQTFIAEFNPGNSTGDPKYYATYNDKNIIVAPTPASALTIQIQYIKNAPHFDSSTSTMLSDQYENLLLYGVLVECFSYLKGPLDMYNLYKTRYDKALEAFALEQMGSRRRGQYTDGVPRVKIDSPSP